MFEAPLTQSQRTLIAYAFTPKPIPAFFDATGGYNDSYTRHATQGSITNYLSTLKAQRDIYDFQVICDERNNSPSRIDACELWVDITIQDRRGKSESISMNMPTPEHIVYGLRAIFRNLTMPRDFSL